MPIPIWVYILVILSAVAQVIGWYMLAKIIYTHLELLKRILSRTAKWLLSLAAIAVTIKFLLQVGSTYPSLSTLAFGFRPIVIGYLHLVLLGVITIFIIGYIAANNYVSLNKKAIGGISIFVFGIIYNEILLMTQGVSNMILETIPFTNELLFTAAIIMFIGVLLLVISQFKVDDSIKI